MTYTISVRVYQTNPDAHYEIVEKTACGEGNWTESKNEQVLCMNNSGSSGVLRFLDDTCGDSFTVALGVQNYKTWCDIVTNLQSDQTCIKVHPEYYRPGNRAQARERSLTTYSVTNEKGRKVTVNYTVAEGNELRANVVVA